MDIEVCVYIENGTEITSSHRSSNGFVYSGYHYQKPIVYTSMPFNLSDEQKESIKMALCKYETRNDFEPDWGISFGRASTYFHIEHTQEFVSFLNTLNISDYTFYDGEDNNDDSGDGCILSFDDKGLFTAHYKKHDFNWYLKTLPVLKEMGVNYRCVLSDLLSVATDDISEFIDIHQLDLAQVRICDYNGNLKECIKNSKNPEVVAIRELIDNGYTYRALKAFRVNPPGRYEMIKKFEANGAFSF